MIFKKIMTVGNKTNTFFSQRGIVFIVDCRPAAPVSGYNLLNNFSVRVLLSSINERKLLIISIVFFCLLIVGK